VATLFAQLHIGSDPCVLLARRIVRIVPLSPLRSIPGAPAGVAGTLLYDCEPVPVIDLTQLILHRPAERRLSTRIILVNAFDQQSDGRLLGLIAEKVTNTLQLEESSPARPAQQTGMGLGRVIALSDRVVQCIDPERLLARSLLEALYADIGVCA
jgi:chemotaxis-related protein WspB